MRRAFWTAALAVCAMILGLGIYLLGCTDKKGTEPKPPTDYRVYFADVDHPYTYFAYHSATGVVDSFDLPYPSNDGFAISPDGKIMYLLVDSAVVCIELDSLTIVDEHLLGFSGGGVLGNRAIISPDGTFLAIFGGGVNILTLPDFTLVYQDSNSSFNGVFSVDSRTFYCISRDSLKQKYVAEIKLSGDYELLRRYFPYGGLWRILPDNPGTTWFLYFQIHNDLFLFLRYDLLADSAIFAEYIAPGHGDMVLTRDGRYLFFSQPGSLNSDIQAPCYFSIYDVLIDQITRQVSTCNFISDTIPVYLPVNEICLTPDGRQLIGIAALGGGELFTFSLLSMEMERYIFVGNERYLINLTCQSWP